MTSYYATQEGTEIMYIINMCPNWENNKDLVDEIQRLQMIHSIKTRGPKNVKKRKPVAVCIKTTYIDGTVLVFKTAKDCAEHFNVSAATIGKYSNSGKRVEAGTLSGWKFERKSR